MSKILKSLPLQPQPSAISHRSHQKKPQNQPADLPIVAQCLCLYAGTVISERQENLVCAICCLFVIDLVAMAILQRGVYRTLLLPTFLFRLATVASSDRIINTLASSSCHVGTAWVALPAKRGITKASFIPRRHTLLQQKHTIKSPITFSSSVVTSFGAGLTRRHETTTTTTSSLFAGASSTIKQKERYNKDWEEQTQHFRKMMLDPYYSGLPVRPATMETAKDYPPSSTKNNLLLPGRHKYLGGAVDETDGCIYGIPSHARSVICLKTSSSSDGGGCEVQTIPLPETSETEGKYKWLRGILAHGYLYGIPAWANSVLQVDVDSLWDRRSNANDTNKNSDDDHVKLLPLPDGHQPGQTWQWHGAALNANQTAIYAIPSNADKVLKVDLLTHKTSFIPIDVPDEYTNFRFEDTNKWYGGILGEDNAVYGVPYRTCSVLRICCETDTATLVGPDFGCGIFNWHGGIQRNGQIYAFPSHSPYVLKIDTTEDSKGQNCTKLPIVRHSEDHDTVENYKWLGGGVGADGNIYGMPCDASSILKIDVTTDFCSTFGFVGSDKKKWQGAALAQDGCLYAIPSYGEHILRIDTRPSSVSEEKNGKENPYQIIANLPSRKDKWQGAAIGKDGTMYALPENAYRILRVIPPSNKDDNEDFDFEKSHVQVDMM